MIYRLKKFRKGKESIHEGTLEQLAHYFGIRPVPKTAHILVNQIQSGYDIRYGACYERPYIELIP